MNQKLAQTVVAIANEEYTPETRKLAIRLGFVDAFERRGLSSEEVGKAMILSAQGAPPKNAEMSAAAYRAMAILAPPVLGAIAGDFTGAAHHDIERELDKKNDPELLRIKKKRRAMERVALEMGGYGVDGGQPRIAMPPNPSKANPVPGKKKDDRMTELLD